MCRSLRRFAPITFAIVLLVMLAGCAAPAKPAPTKAPAAKPTATTAAPKATPTKAAAAQPTEAKPAAAATVMVGSTQAMGKFLVAANGMTLYIFKNDEPGKSNCTGDCAKRWPSLLVKEGEKPIAGEGVTGKLDVIERADATYQVTHDGMPLYFFADDKAPGDAKGEGVGNVWSVVKQ